LSDTFHIKNYLKHGVDFSPLLFDFALEYAIMKVHENQQEVEISGASQFPVCVDHVILLGENINIAKKSTETFIKFGLEANTHKKYLFTSRHQNEEQNHNIKIVNRSFENVENFKYFEKTISNQNLIHEETSSRLNSGKVCSR
jgi:hypothetical protein